MCVAALALVTWGALLMDNRDPLATALALLVPFADAVLVWLALRLVRLARSEPDGYAYIAGALGCLLVVDAVARARSTSACSRSRSTSSRC